MWKKVAVAGGLLAIVSGIAARSWAHEETVKAPVVAKDVVVGDFKIMGNGTVRSWVQMGKNRQPTAVGITFSETALTGLPQGVKGDSRRSSFEYSMKLPSQAKATNIDHISFDWEPLGHEPKGVYDVPHFDLHFYSMTMQERAKIDGRGMAVQKLYKKPAAQYVPAAYILAPGTGVPRMGAHWVNTASPELRGGKFTHTFVLGSYNGRFTFLEPMFAKSYLETKPNVVVPITQPKTLQKSGLFPTRYNVSYNAARHEYTIALENWQWRK